MENSIQLTWVYLVSHGNVINVLCPFIKNEEFLKNEEFGFKIGRKCRTIVGQNFKLASNAHTRDLTFANEQSDTVCLSEPSLSRSQKIVPL